MLQERARSDRGNTKLSSSVEVLDIVRDDEFRLSGDSQFEHHIITWIAEAGPPEVKNVLVTGLAAEVVDEVGNMLSGLADGTVSEQNRFVLDDQRNGDHQLEQTMWNQAKSFERSARARSPTSDKNGGIKDHTHRCMVSLVIPPSSEKPGAHRLHLAPGGCSMVAVLAATESAHKWLLAGTETRAQMVKFAGRAQCGSGVR